MYQILSEEGFADSLITKLVGSEFGQKIAVACEMQQQLLEKINTMAGSTQKIQQQISSEAGSSNATNKEKKDDGDNKKNEFDKQIQASIDRLKNYAQEQLKSVIAHKESLSQGFKNIANKISLEIPNLLTAVLSKKMEEVFDGWQLKLQNSIKKRLDKIFKKDKSKDSNADKKAISNSASTSKENSKQPNKQEKSGKASDEQADSNSYDPLAAITIFRKKMDDKKTDYVKIMEDSFTIVNSSAEQHFNKMLTGAESFSQGFKGIFKNMTNEITQMLLKIAYTQYVEKPLSNLFSNIMEGVLGGGKKGGTKVSSWTLEKQLLADRLLPTAFEHRAKGGPVSSGSLYRVGEEGEEWFAPSSSGNIISNHDVRAMSKSNIQAPPVIVNVVNKSGVQANTRQETKWDGQQYIVNVVMDAYARNVSGMRDVLGARR